MITGNIKKIDLSTSSFKRMIDEGNLYVDKTRLIERFLNVASSVQLVVRQRRLGKSLNMDMLRCFLTDKEDLRHLFLGLYVEKSPVWDKAHSAPVFYFNFKGLRAENYKQKIYDMICEYIESYCNEAELSREAKRYLSSDNFDDTDGLLHLTKSVLKATGKRSYLLIDEYDRLMMENYNTDKYEEIKSFETALLSAVLKGNHSLEKALITGVMRISHESIMSGLNNLVTYDVFNDNVYMDDYGLTDEEAAELGKLADFDLDDAKSWYNGVKINGRSIYNIYSLMSFMRRGKYDCYWGKSGTMDMVTALLNDERKASIAKLLGGERAKVAVDDRISLYRLSSNNMGDDEFYSLLVQAGYLTLDEKLPGNNMAALTIPNKELLIVWQNFIFKNLYSDAVKAN